MLDFSQVMPQIQAFSAERARSLPQLQAALEEAGRRLRASGPKWEATQARIADSRTSWLVADWLEPPDLCVPPPPCPTPCVVYAADGSQIVADRHDIAPCYLLNIGLIALRYGTGERATLTSRPNLAPPEDDLMEEFQGEQVVIAPPRLAIRRLLAEVAGLVELIQEEETGKRGNGEMEPPSPHFPISSFPHFPPALALFDGSLILWTLEKQEEAFRAETLEAYKALLETARRMRVPLVGYISQPGSRDVINALRIVKCPHTPVNCDKHCPNRGKPKPLFVAPDCAGTERITDADLFAARLAPGERSAVFGSRSKILGQYAEGQTIRFFYLNTGREVARVEIPDWVAADPELLAQTHALCCDQARKGDGYPVALAEAHEQAIVRGAERAAFFHLMERAFVTTHQPVAVTQKAVSKRARRV